MADISNQQLIDNDTSDQGMSTWFALRTLEKTYDINLHDQTTAPCYNSLQDKSLQDYFNSPHVKSQLESFGMITKDGVITDEKTFKREQVREQKFKREKEAEKERILRDFDRQIELNIRKEIRNKLQGESKLKMTKKSGYLLAYPDSMLRTAAIYAPGKFKNSNPVQSQTRPQTSHESSSKPFRPVTSQKSKVRPKSAYSTKKSAFQAPSEFSGDCEGNLELATKANSEFQSPKGSRKQSPRVSKKVVAPETASKPSSNTNSSKASKKSSPKGSSEVLPATSEKESDPKPSKSKFNSPLNSVKPSPNGSHELVAASTELAKSLSAPLEKAASVNSSSAKLPSRKSSSEEQSLPLKTPKSSSNNNVVRQPTLSKARSTINSKSVRIGVTESRSDTLLQNPRRISKSQGSSKIIDTKFDSDQPKFIKAKFRGKEVLVEQKNVKVGVTEVVQIEEKKKVTMHRKSRSSIRYLKITSEPKSGAATLKLSKDDSTQFLKSSGENEIQAVSPKDNFSSRGTSKGNLFFSNSEEFASTNTSKDILETNPKEDSSIKPVKESQNALAIFLSKANASNDSGDESKSKSGGSDSKLAEANTGTQIESRNLKESIASKDVLVVTRNLATDSPESKSTVEDSKLPAVEVEKNPATSFPKEGTFLPKQESIKSAKSDSSVNIAKSTKEKTIKTSKSDSKMLKDGIVEFQSISKNSASNSPSKSKIAKEKAKSIANGSKDNVALITTSAEDPVKEKAVIHTSAPLSYDTTLETPEPKIAEFSQVYGPVSEAKISKSDEKVRKSVSKTSNSAVEMIDKSKEVFENEGLVHPLKSKSETRLPNSKDNIISQPPMDFTITKSSSSQPLEPVKNDIDSLSKIYNVKSSNSKIASNSNIKTSSNSNIQTSMKSSSKTDFSNILKSGSKNHFFKSSRANSISSNNSDKIKKESVDDIDTLSKSEALKPSSSLIQIVGNSVSRKNSSDDISDGKSNKNSTNIHTEKSNRTQNLVSGTLKDSTPSKTKSMSSINEDVKVVPGKAQTQKSESVLPTLQGNFITASGPKNKVVLEERISARGSLKKKKMKEIVESD